MDKKIAALLAAVAGVATMGSAQAATPPANPSQAGSYADLLAPIPNAAETLKAEDAAQAQTQRGLGFKLAQYYPYYGYGYRRHHHHHHHHHHHNWGWRPY